MGNADRTFPAVPPVYTRVLEVVREIPYGQVATYGQIAMIVGNCTPRMVGYCLASLGRGYDDRGNDDGRNDDGSIYDDGKGVPWHRVINRQGKISPRGVGFGAQIQRELLLQEGVEFSQADRISFRRFGWMDPY